MGLGVGRWRLIDCPARTYEMTDMAVTHASGFTRKRSDVLFISRS